MSNNNNRSASARVIECAGNEMKIRKFAMCFQL